MAPDAVAGTEAKAANLGLRDIDIISPREHPLTAQEAEAIRDNVEDAIAERIALLLGLSLEQFEDEILLFKPAVASNIKLASHLTQVVKRL